MTTLVDTSCLLRLPYPTDPRHLETEDALAVLAQQGETFFIGRQNVIEFWGIATRPREEAGRKLGGLGMTPEQADAELTKLQGLFTILPEFPATLATWRDLCLRARVSGRQVHDTHLMAVCMVAQIDILLTWNPGDFTRFRSLAPTVQVLTPADVLQSHT